MDRFNPQKPAASDMWFGPNGYYRTGNLSLNPTDMETLKKGATMTGLTYVSSTSWFDPIYSPTAALLGLTRETSLFKLLPKTTYQQVGDSIQVITTDSSTNNLTTGESGAVFGTETTVPSLVDYDMIIPAVCTAQWEDTEMAVALSQMQKSRTTLNPDQIREYMTLKYWDWIDRQLCGVVNDPNGTPNGFGVDMPATDGSYAQIECIDRIVSCKAEQLGGTYLSATTDGDIYWNNTGLAGTARVDRDTVTTWDAQVKLPSVPATGDAYNILDELDDLFAVAKNYAKQPYNYIGVCSPKALNKIQNELDPKARFLEGEMNVTQTVNGVSTRQGVNGGKLSVASLTICGTQIPFFDIPYLGGTAESSWLWLTSVQTTGGVGNIYLLNMDDIEYRTLIPPTYKSWFNTDTGDAPGIGNRHMLYMMGQLVAKNFPSHCALKNIAV